MPLMKMLTKMCILCRLEILGPSPKNGSKDVASQDADTHFFLYFHEGHQDFATSQHLNMLLNQNIQPVSQNLAEIQFTNV